MRKNKSCFKRVRGLTQISSLCSYSCTPFSLGRRGRDAAACVLPSWQWACSQENGTVHQCKNASFTERVADCARWAFINRSVLCSQTKTCYCFSLMSKFCLEPAACLLLLVLLCVQSTCVIQTGGGWKVTHIFHVYASSFKWPEIRLDARLLGKGALVYWMSLLVRWCLHLTRHPFSNVFFNSHISWGAEMSVMWKEI